MRRGSRRWRAGVAQLVCINLALNWPPRPVATNKRELDNVVRRRVTGSCSASAGAVCDP
ncbi:unnamed protein product, partial [Protopolystoma xenopodis]